MTDKAKTLAEFIADFKEQLARLEALPNTGSVLYCDETNLAIAVPGDKSEEGYISGLQNARIYSDQDRCRPFAPGLDCQYADGAGRAFHLFDIATAKRLAIGKMTDLIKNLENQI